MLRQIRHGKAGRSIWTAIESAACSTLFHHQFRGIRLFEIFSKEKREERRKQLREEMQRGYFDDFRDFRDTGGKVFRAPEGLIPSAAAPSFPKSQMLLPDNSPIEFPFVRDADNEDIPYLTLTCIAFRAGAQDMVDSWKTVFEDAIAQNEGQGKSAFVELALIESVVMASWPFRSMIMAQGLRNGTSCSPSAGNLDAHRLSTRYLYHFGDASTFRSALQMTNRLTAYAYLLDAHGKVRWRGSGKPDKREKEVLTTCCTKLLLSSNS